MPRHIPIKIHEPTLIMGVCLTLSSLFVPAFFTVDSFGISRGLTTAVRTIEPILLMQAALRLVFLNVLRSLPHYCGAFLIAEAIIIPNKSRRNTLFKAAIVCIIIPMVYYMIECIYAIHYDFGVPALVLLCLLTFIEQANYNLVSMIKKVLMLTSFIAAMQFLDVMPSLKQLPVGRGETSQDVKIIAAFLGIEHTLDSIATVFFLLLLFVGVLLLFLIRDENHLRLLGELKEQNERMQMEARMRALENRTYMELRHLVHDLKSPLTSAQALVGVLKLSAQEQQAKGQTIRYFEHIEQSIDRMSNMVSEILNENHFSLLQTKDIISPVLAQISISDYAHLVKINNEIPEQVLYVNKIRMVRALVNLIENAFYAVDPSGGEILLSLGYQCTEGQQLVQIVLSDNGKGMSPQEIAAAWESGYSTRGSHGLGLSFVKKVLTTFGGTVSIASAVGSGTTVTLILPKGEITSAS